MKNFGVALATLLLVGGCVSLSGQPTHGRGLQWASLADAEVSQQSIHQTALEECQSDTKLHGAVKDWASSARRGVAFAAALGAAIENQSGTVMSAPLGTLIATGAHEESSAAMLPCLVGEDHPVQN